MAYLILDLDEKGRLLIPKEIRDKLELKGGIVAETHENALVLKSIKVAKDPLKHLTSLNVKGTAKKTPLQLKREAQKAMAEGMG